MSGARYAERPVTMRERHSGHSKKAGNLVYGYRYGRVVLRTFVRETRRRAGLPTPAKPDRQQPVRQLA